MAVLATSSVRFLSCLALLFSEIAFALTLDDHIWERNFLEMKVMLSGLDSKVSGVDSKLSQLQLIVSPIDHQLKALSSRMDHLGQQVESIKETLRNAPHSQRTEVQTERAEHGRVVPNRNEQMVTSNIGAEILEKVDDYGKKMVKSFQDREVSEEREKRSMTGLLETVRSGFSKLVQKVESLQSLEGQMSGMVSNIHRLKPQITAIEDQISMLSTDLALVKTDVGDGHRQLSTQFANVSGYINGMLNDIKANSGLQAAQLSEAIEMGNQMRGEMTQLSQLEPKLVSASNLAQFVMNEVSNNAGASESLQNNTRNLTSTLDVVEKSILPLMMSLPYRQENMHAVLEDLLRNAANQTGPPCNASGVFQLEIGRLRDLMMDNFGGPQGRTRTGGSSGERSEKWRSFTDRLMAIQVEVNNKEGEVMEKLAFIKDALIKMREDLQRPNNRNQVLDVKPLGEIIG